MGRKKKSRDYSNMDIPFEELAKPRNKKEMVAYGERAEDEFGPMTNKDAYDDPVWDEKTKNMKAPTRNREERIKDILRGAGFKGV